MFFGLLRRSNVLFSAGNKGATLSRNQICFHSWGVIMEKKKKKFKLKTIQFQERELLLPLPRIREHPSCPVQAIFRCFSPTPRAAADGWAFVVPTGAGVKPLSPVVFVKRMRTALSASGCDTTRYVGHSFRRGGATWAYKVGLPVDTIRMLGDWRSSAFQAYIALDEGQLRSVVASMIHTIPSTTTTMGVGTM